MLSNPGLVRTLVAQRTADGNLLIPTDAVNPLLTCPLCHGYYRDATTINECLHTFCYVCLMQALGEQQPTGSGVFKCPRCKLVLGCDLRSCLRSDRALQGLADKLFPPVSASATANDSLSAASSSSSSSSSAAPSSSAGAAEAARSLDSLDEITFILQADTGFGVPNTLPQLPKPFIRCSAEASIVNIKKFIIQKLKPIIAANPAFRIEATDDLDILLGGEILGAEYTLKFIRRTRWHDEQSDMIMTYRPTLVKM